MLENMPNFLRTFFGIHQPWEVLTLSRVGIDPVTARSLTRVLQPSHTIRLRPEAGSDLAESGPELVWHGITDRGMLRRQNEDCFSLQDLGNRALFVVADGMGGHDLGEVASSIAVEAVSREVTRGRDTDPLTLVERAIGRANADVKRAARSRSSNMGTTLTVALVDNGVAFIGSVGDSRAYWIGNGAITQITEDHSLVAKLVASGKLGRDEARGHPKSNLLYRTIGNDEEVEAGLYRVDMKKGGTLLLCTDGLWNEVSDEELRQICSDEEQTEIMCARLVQQANAQGSRDNVTAIVVKAL